MKRSSRSAKSRLDRTEWLETAIDVLMDGGIRGITIDRMARILGVTRGSFYHHFADREDLLRAMLDFWESELTIRIRDEVQALRLDPRTTLLALSRAIRHRKAAEYDVAFRAWALHDPMARKVVRETDEIRLEYIRGLFQELGFTDMDAENRARLFLYYEVADPVVFAEQAPEVRDRLVEERHRFLTSGQPDPDD